MHTIHKICVDLLNIGKSSSQQWAISKVFGESLVVLFRFVLFYCTGLVPQLLCCSRVKCSTIFCFAVKFLFLNNFRVAKIVKRVPVYPASPNVNTL